LLSHCFQRVPFYRERLLRAGIRRESDFRPEALVNLPPLGKEDIQDNSDALLSQAVPRGDWEENSSGGSTGNPVNLIQDRNYREEALATSWVSDLMQGWRFGHRRALLWGSPKDVGLLNRLGWRISKYLHNENLYDSFDMGVPRMESFHRHLSRFRPDVIVAYSSSACLLAQFLSERRLRPGYPSTSIISSAETLTDAMRASIMDCFGVPVYNRYGTREAGTVASECEKHCGLHLHMLDHYLEVVDFETGRPVWDRPGRVLITLLTNYAMPLLRYDIGDVGVLTHEPCPCGRETLVLKQLLGRVSDFITSPAGRLVHGEYFTHAFYGHRGIRQFQFVQEARAQYTVRIVKAADFNPADIADIKEDILAVLGRDAELRFEFPETIAPMASGKFRFTISHVPVSFTAPTYESTS